MKRPVFLTIWLVLMALGSAYSIYSYTLGSAMVTQVLNIPQWALWTLAAAGVVELAAVYMLWSWKKLGFQLVVGITVVAAVINLMIFGALGIGAVVFGVIGLGILYLAMKPVWNNFK